MNQSSGLAKGPVLQGHDLSLGFCSVGWHRKLLLIQDHECHLATEDGGTEG